MTTLSHRFHWSVLASAGVLTLTLGLALAAPATAASHLNCYLQANLVSNIPNLATHTDANLVNAWGLASSATSPFWVSDNGTGVTTLYNGKGEPFPVGTPLVVTIPPTGSAPTGQVFNEFNATSPSDFVVADHPSLFIFATEDGTISAWNLFVTPLTAAVLVVDNSASGAVYKGLAIGSSAAGNFLYAANFHAGRIDVFDGKFAPVVLPLAFFDPEIPAGFAPFNIQNLDGQLYVTYAKQDEDKHDDVAGEGNGFVNVFDTNGKLIQRVATDRHLNSPWGLALAPADFGPFSNDVLVGNFGDGRINAYRQLGGEFSFHGKLRDSNDAPITIDGLWALRFGSGAPPPTNNGPANVLFFTAGPNHEQDGLFGRLDACLP